MNSLCLPSDVIVGGVLGNEWKDNLCPAELVSLLACRSAFCPAGGVSSTFPLPLHIHMEYWARTLERKALAARECVCVAYLPYMCVEISWCSFSLCSLGGSKEAK